MRVAIIGAGMAGLSACWHLLSLGAEVTLFDSKGIGGGASGVSTGLLYPFPGLSALRSLSSDLGMKATEELLQVAERALKRKVAERTGIFRPAVTDRQKKDFSYRAEQDSDAIWQDHSVFGPGIWIPKGITVYSRTYLAGLWEACSGAHLINEKITSLTQLEAYDKIVVTAGFETAQFDECRHLPLKPTKGQVLICRWPEPLDFSLVSQGHIALTENRDFCQIGSTYERAFDDLNPDPAKALELKEKVACFYPLAREFEVVEIRAAVRISPINGYLPIIAKVNDKTWAFTGLGSRGLLYHALFGKELAAALFRL
jgi:glycine/D-amino acid oxidase-like deaminating enzyme